MPQNLYELGGLVAIFLFAIKEFFGYLKTKNGNINGGTHDKKVFEELKTMNENHLQHIEAAIREGNRDTIKALNDGNLQIVAALGEIKGNLQR